MISLIASFWVWMMVRRDPAGRPWLTGLCLVLLMALPFLAMLPKFQVNILAVGVEGGSQTSAGSWHWLLWLWGLGVSTMMFRWVRGHIVLKQWLRDSVEVVGDDWDVCMSECQSMLGMGWAPEIRLKRGLLSPVVSGLWYPVILMPEGSGKWSFETRKMALLHELGHVQRKDLWLRAVADLACVLHWYNPLVHWMRVKLLSQCEYACDARVIASGVDQGSYITALCDVLESAMGEARPSGALAMADHAPLKLRVDRLVRGTTGGRVWGAWLAAVLMVSAALGGSLVQPVPRMEAQAIGAVKRKPEMKLEVERRHRANPFPANEGLFR